MCIVFICLAEIFIAGSSSGIPAIVRALSAKNKSTCSKHLDKWNKLFLEGPLFF